MAKRRAGFTCPKCNSAFFRTYLWQEGHGPEFKAGTTVGHCKQNEYTGNGCQFTWDRNSPVEAEVMHEQTEAEHIASYENR
jgi:hypothetical protein